MSGRSCELEVKEREQSRVLIVLLVINAVMFLVEVITGIFAESTALIADSLDMLADAAVYSIGLYAIGKSLLVKAKAAYLSGVFQILLGFGVLIDILRRVVLGSEPESMFMIGIGIVALMANTVCLMLLHKHRQGEVHMRASWIFSRNDVIANTGVICGGLLVAYTGSAWPDLIIAVLITAIIVRGGIHIIKDAIESLKVTE